MDHSRKNPSLGRYSSWNFIFSSHPLISLPSRWWEVFTVETSPSRQKNRLRALKRVPLLQLLPPLHAAGLDAHHLLVAVLGRKVGHGRGLVDPRVPDDGVVEVVADDAEARLARLGDDERVRGALGRGVDAVGLGGEGDGVGGLGLGGEVVDLVDVGRIFDAGDLNRRDVLHNTIAISIGAINFRVVSSIPPYVNGKICVQQRLELKRHVAVVCDDERRVEALLVEGHAVQQAKLVRPGGLELVVDALGREAKVELDAGGARGPFAGGLAEELPPRVAREAVLLQLGGGLVIGRGAKDLSIRRC